MARFGDTAANTLAIEYFKTTNLPVFVKTLCASGSAASFRILLMPVDTIKTYMQVEGSLKGLFLKYKSNGFSVFFQGAMGAFASTYVGHFPWFFTNNWLSSVIPKGKTNLQNFSRSALIGFCSSVVSDSVSNSLRVVKVYKQASSVQVSYPTIVKDILKKEGPLGLLGRGLSTRIVSNGLQGVMFNVLWKYFETKARARGY